MKWRERVRLETRDFLLSFAWIWDKNLNNFINLENIGLSFYSRAEARTFKKLNTLMQIVFKEFKVQLSVGQKPKTRQNEHNKQQTDVSLSSPYLVTLIFPPCYKWILAHKSMQKIHQIQCKQLVGGWNIAS